MAILNYSTKIDPFKTIGEIQSCLVKHGALVITVIYEHQLPVSLTFKIEIDGRYILFELPCNFMGVLNAMNNDKKVPRAMCTKEQALRVSWRIIKDWVEAQMAIVEAELCTLPEVFIPYAITNDGRTVYNRLTTSDKTMLITG
jgi:hypothetical protein